MLPRISKVLTIQLPPVMGIISTFLIFFTFLGPLPLDSDSISLVNITPIVRQNQNPTDNQTLPANPNRRRVPRAAALALAERVKSRDVDEPTLRFSFMRSCSKPLGRDEKCTFYSLMPTYDISALSNSVSFAKNPPPLSAITMLLSFLSLAGFSLIGALALIPSSSLSSTLAKPVVVKTTAWLGLIGWVFGMITTTVLYIYFGSNCITFNNDAAAGGEMLLAELASGFSMLGLAFGLALFPLICSLVGQVQPEKSRGKRGRSSSISSFRSSSSLGSPRRSGLRSPTASKSSPGSKSSSGRKSPSISSPNSPSSFSFKPSSTSTPKPTFDDDF